MPRALHDGRHASRVVMNAPSPSSTLVPAFHMDQIIAEVKKIPPVTRFVCGSSLAVTGVAIANILSPYSLLFTKELVFKRFEVWPCFSLLNLKIRF
jgi:Der1-like family